MRISMPLKALVAAGTIAAVMAVGSAFTASNTIPSTATVGYGQTTMSGVTATSILYNTTGSAITSVDMVLTGDTHLLAVDYNFNSDTPASAGVGVYDGTTATTYHIAGLTETVTSANSFAVVATNGTAG
jgi:Cu/Zn superoxide dismutase